MKKRKWKEIILRDLKTVEKDLDLFVLFIVSVIFYIVLQNCNLIALFLKIYVFQLRAKGDSGVDRTKFVDLKLVLKTKFK